MTPAERDELARQAVAQAKVPLSWAGDKRLALELAAAGYPDGVPAVDYAAFAPDPADAELGLAILERLAAAEPDAPPPF